MKRATSTQPQITNVDPKLGIKINMFSGKFFVLGILAVINITLADAMNIFIVNKTDPNSQEICSLIPPNKYILRPNSCTAWMKCPSTVDSLDYEEGVCAAGLFFNKETGRCDYEYNVQCPYRTNHNNRCEGKADQLFLNDPTSKNCRGYVYCKNGKEFYAKCPKNLVFNPKQAACVYPQDYKCPTDERKANRSSICHSIPNRQLFANENDCTKYYECNDGVLLVHECDIDMAFNVITGYCVPRDNVICHPTAKKPLANSKLCGTDSNPHVGYYSDGQTCSGYYICNQQSDKKADRHPVHMVCEFGFFFDETKWSCRDRLNVRCIHDRCEGMNNKYVNIAGDCSSYARCENGTTAATGHCPEKYYFDERTQGCTLQNINYIACAPTESQ